MTPDALVEARRIIPIVSVHTGIEIDVLVAKGRRHGEIVRARRLLVWLMREHTRLSFSTLGRVLSARDHSTLHVVHKRFLADMKKDPELRRRAEKLLASLRGDTLKKASEPPALAQFPRAV